MAVLVSDSFNRANSTTTLGTTDSFNGGTAKTWLAITGTWGISSNAAYNVAATNDAFAVVDSGVADVKVSVTIATPQAELGIYFRTVDANNTLRVVFSVGTWYLQKKVSGSITTIGSQSNALNAGDVIRVETNSSTLTFYINGVLKISSTDSFNSTATKHGIGAGTAGSAARWDDFQIDSFASGTSVNGSATFSGTGTLMGTGVASISKSASFQGTGSLTATGTVRATGSATFQGIGSLTASGGYPVFGSASFTGVGSLTALGVTGGSIADSITLYAREETSIILSASEEFTVNLYALESHSVILGGGP